MKAPIVAASLVLSSALVLAGGDGQQTASQSLVTLKAAPGLEITLWASEPELTNPTDMAIDERGRVWVTEGVNYRRALRNLPDIRPAGDRIVILEDVNHDGRADEVKVFDQSPDIRSPLGIAVFGNKVYVSQSPHITVYTKDAEDRIISKEVLLDGWKGMDHDHGLHAMVFGPDGRYYLDAGNEGYDVTDKSGTRVRMDATAGYFQGAAMRMNVDGTGLEVLGQNFRNPYELALDSFGTIFQTDNDDDGNAWTRLNYVMEGGNFGFRGPLNRTWTEDRGTHFHSEVPGVVPNITRLGAGSPAGLVVYEGKLLPEKYQGQLLHAEAGKRIVGAYLQSEDGAGYSTRVEDGVSGADTWFRPTDVAVAPDGAVYIADWYDPAVGGHGMGDPQGGRGRIYRLAPPNYKSQVPNLNVSSADGLTAALGSPNQSAFYLAHTALRAQGQAALPALQKMWKQNDPVLRARALWILSGLGADGTRAVGESLRDPDPRFRVLALRIMKMQGADMVATSRPLLHDPSPQVRREIAVLLRDPSRMIPPYLAAEQTTSGAPLLDSLIELTKQYDGKDRWYLEAMGIAARGREDALYARLRGQYPAGSSTFAQLLWELRPKAAMPDLIAAVKDRSRGEQERLQALDVLSVMQWPEAAQAVESVIVDDGNPPALVEKAFGNYAHQLVSLWMDSRKSPSACGDEEGVRHPGAAVGRRGYRRCAGRRAVSARHDDARELGQRRPATARDGADGARECPQPSIPPAVSKPRVERPCSRAHRGGTRGETEGHEPLRVRRIYAPREFMTAA